jgi:hypothetical protein
VSSEYKVSFSRTARIVRYEDSQGRVSFGFEYDDRDPATGKWTLVLERPATDLERINSIQDEQLRNVERQRMDMAFERTKQYLLSVGHHVKIWPDEFEKK